jgi:hypothetical protein
MTENLGLYSLRRSLRCPLRTRRAQGYLRWCRLHPSLRTRTQVGLPLWRGLRSARAPRPTQSVKPRTVRGTVTSTARRKRPGSVRPGPSSAARAYVLRSLWSGRSSQSPLEVSRRLRRLPEPCQGRRRVPPYGHGKTVESRPTGSHHLTGPSHATISAPIERPAAPADKGDTRLLDQPVGSAPGPARGRDRPRPAHRRVRRCTGPDLAATRPGVVMRWDLPRTSLTAILRRDMVT